MRASRWQAWHKCSLAVKQQGEQVGELAEWTNQSVEFLGTTIQ